MTRATSQPCSILALVVVLATQVWPADEKNECLECHLERDPDVYPAVDRDFDVHLKAGLVCADCHGGDPSTADPKLAKAEGTGYVGKPHATQVPGFCGKCHSNAEFMRRYQPGVSVDQEQKYVTSHHGQLLAEGDENVATCVSCHGSHGMRAVKDPLSPVFPTNVPGMCAGCHADAAHMAPYGIATDQMEKYRVSVHGMALLERKEIGAPACNDCHGNHGAQPPDVASINHVCGQCHPRNAELVRESFHSEAVDLFEEPECAVCHGHHDIQPPSFEVVNMGEDGICTKCHEDEPDSSAVEFATTLTRERRKLEDAVSMATERLELSHRKGMIVDEVLEYVEATRAARFTTRTLVHAFDADLYVEACAEGVTLAESAIVAADGLLASFKRRRLGLAISTGFITLVVIGLYLKIREIEREQDSAPNDEEQRRES